MENPADRSTPSAVLLRVEDDEGQGISAGGYITPDLYVEYDAGSNDQSSVTRIQYDLTDKIQIQTESGDDQGVDVFFKFER